MIIIALKGGNAVLKAKHCEKGSTKTERKSLVKPVVGGGRRRSILQLEG